MDSSQHAAVEAIFLTEYTESYRSYFLLAARMTDSITEITVADVSANLR